MKINRTFEFHPSIYKYISILIYLSIYLQAASCLLPPADCRLLTVDCLLDTATATATPTHTPTATSTPTPTPLSATFNQPGAVYRVPHTDNPNPNSYDLAVEVVIARPTNDVSLFHLQVLDTNENVLDTFSLTPMPSNEEASSTFSFVSNPCR